jgi:hypothetical protein
LFTRNGSVNLPIERWEGLGGIGVLLLVQHLSHSLDQGEWGVRLLKEGDLFLQESVPDHGIVRVATGEKYPHLREAGPQGVGQFRPAHPRHHHVRHQQTDLSQMDRLWGAATTPMAKAIYPKVRLQGFSAKSAAAAHPVAA